MKLYHASLSLEVATWYINKFPETRLNVLRSFGLLDRDSYHFCCTKWRDTINSLILDSGTWTLNNTHDETLKKRNNSTLTSILTLMKIFLIRDMKPTWQT